MDRQMEYDRTNAIVTPARARVLILTDDGDASRAWAHVLSRYDIETVVNSYDDLPKVGRQINSFHETLVDHYDDPSDALEICNKLRTMSHQPLLLFAYETDERFHLSAYRIGIEEYVAKPISIPLFVAKTRAWLRQATQSAESTHLVQANGFVLDPESRLLNHDEATVKLSVLEYRLMSLLMTNQGQILELGLLTQRVWAMYPHPDPKMLKNLVYRLRHKLQRISPCREYIESIEGIGYRFHAR